MVAIISKFCTSQIRCLWSWLLKIKHTSWLILLMTMPIIYPIIGHDFAWWKHVTCLWSHIAHDKTNITVLGYADYMICLRHDYPLWNTTIDLPLLMNIPCAKICLSSWLPIKSLWLCCTIPKTEQDKYCWWLLPWALESVKFSPRGWHLLLTFW